VDATVTLRADAQRNRARILEAAAALFAERGLDVSMEDIAKGAGVGVGTLYRRFADRDALIDALFEAKIHAIAAIATESLAIEDPWEALRSFILRVATLQARDRGLKETLLTTNRGSERLAQARDTIRPIAGQLIERAKAAGVLREDFGDFDIPLMQFAVGYVADRMREIAPEYHQRMITLLLDGMVAQRSGVTPMPVPPLTDEQFARSTGRC
jgi:AcrR family transcriptional regulator